MDQSKKNILYGSCYCKPKSFFKDIQFFLNVIMLLNIETLVEIKEQSFPKKQ